ncbi:MULTISPECIES: hypothetical protein [unclassified Frankia]|uniref:hypothetical protein n=1 Tax=unclassified Frankia TaxID=2632575 RepID=UPI0020255B1D
MGNHSAARHSRKQAASASQRAVPARTPAATGTPGGRRADAGAATADSPSAAEPVRSPRIFRKRDAGPDARLRPVAPAFPPPVSARPGAMFIPRQQLMNSAEPDTLSGPSPFGADRARPDDRQAHGTRRGAHREIPVRQPTVRQPRPSRNRLVATGTASLAGISALLTGIALAGAQDEQVVDLGAAAAAPSVGLGSSPSVLQQTAGRTSRNVHRPAARPAAPPPQTVVTPGPGFAGNDPLWAAGAPSPAGTDLPQAVATHPEYPYPAYSYYSHAYYADAAPSEAGPLPPTPAPATQPALEQPAFPGGAVTDPVEVTRTSEPSAQPTTTTLRGFETGQTPLAGAPAPAAGLVGVPPTPVPSEALPPAAAVPAATGSSASTSQPPTSSAVAPDAQAAAPQPHPARAGGAFGDRPTKLIEFYDPPPFSPLSR